MRSRGCLSITVDFAMAASQNDVSITQQMGHILILFHDWSMIKKDDSNKKSNGFCDFMNYIGFLMKKKLISTESVM